MLLMSSGSSMTELICAFLAGQLHAKCPSWWHVKHLHGGHCFGGLWSVCVAFLYALPPQFPCCLGAHAQLLVSISTAMLFIHGGVLDEVTCCDVKPHVGCGLLGWKCGRLLLPPKHWKSGAFCVIELTNCIDLTMAMSCFFMAL